MPLHLLACALRYQHTAWLTCPAKHKVEMDLMGTSVYRAKYIVNDASRQKNVQYELTQMRLRPHRL